MGRSCSSLLVNRTAQQSNTVLAVLLVYSSPLWAWEPVLNKDGVQIYERKSANSDVHELKGMAVIDAPMLEVLTVVLDYTKFKEWQANLITFERLKVVSEIEFVNYAAMDMPWPVTKRDMVMRARFDIDRKKRWFHVRWKETTWPSKPVTQKFVRVRTARVMWSLQPIEKGKRTRVEFRALGDPGGWIPAWLVNYFSKYMLADSFKRLSGQVARKRLDPKLMQKYRFVESWY